MDGVLDRLLSSRARALLSHPDRPFVCATWAQSANGMIAAAPGVRTLISGEESMAMTHMLRAAHDTILVGVGTALADDPRLSCRLKEPDLERVDKAFQRHNISVPVETDRSPVAVILDPKLRITTKLKFLDQAHCRDLSRRPFIFFADSDICEIDEANQNELEKQARLKRTPVELSEMNACRKHSTLLSLPPILKTLRRESMCSVMVEGGAAVLSSFLKSGLCDLVIITISPKLFGTGLTLADRAESVSFPSTELSDPEWVKCGDDIILIGAPR